MRKLLVIIVCLLIVVDGAFAQSSMTENQIKVFITQQQEMGKSNQEIAAELMKRGVSVEALKRMKDKYERQAKNASSTDVRSKSDDRMRESNAVVVRDSSQIMDDVYMEALGQKRIFGHDIFNNTMLSFEPNDNVSTPSNYVLGPGDEVFIDIYGASQLSVDAKISPDGYVTIDGVGPVKLGNMTVAQANSRLRSVLAECYSSSKVQLTVGQTRSINVNVMGEVKTPGTYTISAFATAFHALYAAGGVNDIGTLRSILIYRNGSKVADIDVYEYILNGKTQSDIHLNTGDVVYVGPYHCLVDIEGKVKRPMMYEMKQAETLGTLLRFAGDFTGKAYKKNVRVVRRSGYDYTVHTVEEFDFSAFKMMDGDSVTVDNIIPRFSNMVEVRGAVYRPGQYQMDGKIKTVRELMTSIDGATKDALLGRAVIYRMKGDLTREVLSFNLGALMEGKASDITLRNEDIIEVFSQERTKAGRTLTIYGEVNMPGVYNYADGTSLEDLILRAGGLTDAASIQNIEVSRHEIDPVTLRQNVAMVKAYSLSLPDKELGVTDTDDNVFTLMPYDVVYVRKSPSWHVNRNVVVSGEVNFEGSFALQRKDERMSDIIRRAGGLTDYAFVEGAHLERRMSDDEMERKKALLRLTHASSDSIDMSSLDISDVYTVGINLREALEKPGSVADVILCDGDRLVIPEIQNLIKVNGAVMYPNAVAWQKGKKAKFYINMAGGYSSEAKKKNAFVVSLNGTVQRAKKVKSIQPGSEIVVPTKEKGRRMTTSEIATIGTSTASMATMIATLVNLFK